ncbi:MAG: putative glycolipid-binding domain-containing protein [bacterium]|nr:putative glycolipid-binding domain-containing protein [bacterium]
MTRYESLWSPWDGNGMEHLRLTVDATRIVADGMVIGVAAEKPFRLRYQIICDLNWEVRHLEVNVLSSFRRMKLEADGRGGWQTAGGVAFETLNGCVDVDLSITPLTNTLPIRRLSLQPGKRTEILVVYITLPELEVRPARQWYTYLGEQEGLRRFQYEDESFGGFKAVISVDEHGLVTEYPDLFRRVWFGKRD